jgi:hypothetical protein
MQESLRVHCYWNIRLLPARLGAKVVLGPTPLLTTPSSPPPLPQRRTGGICVVLENVAGELSANPPPPPD